MGLTDVFAKWLLGKLDEKLLRKKRLSVEERLQLLHGYLHSTKDLCDSRKIDVQNIKEAIETLPLEPPGPHGDFTLAQYLDDANFQFFEPSKRERVRILTDIGDHLTNLRFLFERMGYPELAEAIGFNAVVSMGACRGSHETFRSLKRAVARKDAEHVRRLHEELSHQLADISHGSETADKLIGEVLELANAMRE